MPLAAITGLESRRVPTRTLRSACMGRRTLAGELTAKILSRVVLSAKFNGSPGVMRALAVRRSQPGKYSRPVYPAVFAYNNKIDVSCTESYARKVSDETYGVLTASYSVNAGCVGAGLGNWGAAAEIFACLRGAEPSVLSVIIARECLGRSVVSVRPY